MVCTAEARPEELLNTEVMYSQEVDILGTIGGVQDNQDEAFAFERTVSRLTQMQSEEYLQQAHMSVCETSIDTS